MASPAPGMSSAVKARLLLVMLGLSWGLTWPAMRFALYDLPPFTMRTLTAFIGATAMFMLARLVGPGVKIPSRTRWPYIVAVSFFNIVVFSVCVAFAQLTSATGRVAILVYTMPIWASVLAWFFLGERLTAARAIALLLCCVGMAVLIYPLTHHGVPLGILLALCAAVSWAIGTVYVKWSHADIDPYTLAAWQLAVAFVVMLCLSLIFEPSLKFSTVHLSSWLGLLFSGLFGSAIAYYLWFRIIHLMPASRASLGALSSPVIGVISSIFLLNEWPTAWDVAGFSIIFAASAIALLEPPRPALPVKGKAQ